MNARVAADAPLMPPETGASTNRKPRLADSSWQKREVSTSTVELSASSVSVLAVAQMPSGASKTLAHVLALGQHGEYDIRTGYSLGNAADDLDAVRGGGGIGGRVQVKASHRVPGLHQVRRHRATHVAQTDPSVLSQRDLLVHLSLHRAASSGEAHRMRHPSAYQCTAGHNNCTSDAHSCTLAACEPPPTTTITSKA